MSVDPERWKYLWLLLSLDRIAPLWNDLWLPASHQASLQTQLRDILAPYLHEERFFHEAEAINIEVLRATNLRCGSAEVGFLRDWCMHILIAAGEDRAQEALWSSICIVIGKSGRDVPEWIQERCRAVSENERRRRTESARNMEANSRRPFDVWDERILPYTHESLADVDRTAELVINQNIFVLSWRDECSGLSVGELAQMKVAAQLFREELGMVGIEIQTPGVWVHALADFLDPEVSDQ